MPGVWPETYSPVAGFSSRFSLLSQGTAQRGCLKSLEEGATWQQIQGHSWREEEKVRGYLLLFPPTNWCCSVKLCQGVGDSGCAWTPNPQYWRPSVLETHHMQPSLCLLQSRAVAARRILGSELGLSQCCSTCRYCRYNHLLTFKPAVALRVFQCIAWTVMSFLLISLTWEGRTFLLSVI